MIDKNKLKQDLTDEDIYKLLDEWGGEPIYTSFGITATTICHNKPKEGSRKLYYYSNSHLFRCYTECDSTFDIFELTSKIMKEQHNLDFNLYDSIKWILNYFNFSTELFDTTQKEKRNKDWEAISNYDRIQELEISIKKIVLKEYDSTILKNLNYNIKLNPWISEGITKEVLYYNTIGYYPTDDCITIPHFDIEGRFIGLRGRYMVQRDCELYGKYHPLKINNVLYTHPLGFNLYNLNNSKKNIKMIKKAIIFEAEKSVLKYQSFFGFENDISIACCGSSISSYQIQSLLDLGVNEIIIAFDRQFEDKGDKEFNRLKNKLISLYNKYKNYTTISFIFDKNMITEYKESPIDQGKDKFQQLLNERIFL